MGDDKDGQGNHNNETTTQSQEGHHDFSLSLTGFYAEPTGDNGILHVELIILTHQCKLVFQQSHSTTSMV